MNQAHSFQVHILGTRYLAVVNGRLHIVGKDRRCHTCNDNQCEAVNEVARYLKAGGQRAPDKLPAAPGKHPLVLPACPICGAAVERDAVLDNAQHGPGWRCTAGGYEHLYLHRYAYLKAWFCGEGVKRHAMFLPDEPSAVQLRLPVVAGPTETNIVPFVDPHQHILKRAARMYASA